MGDGRLRLQHAVRAPGELFEHDGRLLRGARADELGTQPVLRRIVVHLAEQHEVGTLQALQQRLARQRSTGAAVEDHVGSTPVPAPRPA